MLPFQSNYGLFHGSCLNHRNADDHVKRSTSAAGCSIVTADSSKNEKRSTEASRNHKEAERRRRQRINSHLSTLRTLLPNTTKTDKASLLAEVVSHVKELRRRAAEVARRGTDGGGGGAVPWPFPSEEDEATLCYCDSENRVMRATVCCDERSGLNRDLMQAIRMVHARVVRAELMTLGGRTKSVVVLEWRGGDGGRREEEFVGLRRALKAVVENQAQNVWGNKRARAQSPLEDPFFMC